MRKGIIILLVIVLVGITPAVSERPAQGAFAPVDFAATASSDMGTPVLLLEDETDSEYYPTQLTSYFYKTMASIYQYHVIGMYPLQTSPNLYLRLYSDSAYLQKLNESVYLGGATDWIIYRGSGIVYPKVSTGAGGTASARIQWDGATYLYAQETVVNTVNASDFVDLYAFTLFYTNTYNLTLTVPATGDYDLYLYRLGSQPAVNSQGYVNISATNQTGANEGFTDYVPTPSIQGDHVALIVWRNGSGSYSFSFTRTGYSQYWQPEGPIPGFGWLGVVALLGLVYLFYRVRQNGLLPAIERDGHRRRL